MVRTLSAIPGSRQGQHGRKTNGQKRRSTTRVLLAVVLVVGSGCAIVPSSRMDECQRLTQTLRSENARLKDRVLALQGQNRDYAERAVDDARRLAIQDESLERLEHSVQAYQDERARLEAAYKQLASNLVVPEAPTERRHSPAGSNSAHGEDSAPSSSRQSKIDPGVHDDETPR
jgi:hypothetical protein